METTREKQKKLLEELFEDPIYVPMKLKELAVFLQVTKENRDELKSILDEMIRERKAEITPKGKYRKPKQIYLEGSFRRNPKGFGFVAVEGYDRDFFIPANAVGNAMDKDQVRILLINAEKAEAKIERVVRRENSELVGLFRTQGKKCYCTLDDPKINEVVEIDPSKTMGAVAGHKVLIKITDYGKEQLSLRGKVVQILGHKNDPGVDILSVVAALNLPMEFPQDVLEEAESIPDHVLDSEKEGRRDLTGLRMVTIDSEEAKDLDDAVSLWSEDGIYHLGVHIADVSHYVKEGSALDREALNRATSIYLTDRVIPMLPHRLSNGICSLNEKTDRLALSCLMEIDEKGMILSHEITPSVIHVDHRMSYHQVEKILEGDETLKEEYRDVADMFVEMKELSDILRNQRKKRGSIDFDFPESKIVLDEQGKPVSIAPYERSASTDLIEDFMLAANETVAEDYFWQSIPFVYRTHPQPDEEKIRKLSVLLHNFGYRMRTSQGSIHPSEFQRLLAKIDGTPEADFISRICLRSMQKAVYSVNCTGHYGLSARYYCHFTSPIRRYPDLQIHRIIHENQEGMLTSERIEELNEKLPFVALQSSNMERRADEAERTTDKMKKAEYMQSFVGEEMDGVISGITSYGIYVTLPNTVEGMIAIKDLPGTGYTVSEETCSLLKPSKEVYCRLGERVCVRVVSGNKLKGTVDFAPVRKNWLKGEENG